jgi:hypothetical protein
MALLGVGVIGRALAEQITSFDSGGASSPRYTAAEARVRAVGMFVGVLAVLVIVDMVVKPQF